MICEIEKKDRDKILKIAEEIHSHFWSLSILVKGFDNITMNQALEYARQYYGVYIRDSDVIEGVHEKRHKNIKTFEENPQQWYIFNKKVFDLNFK